MMHVVAYARAKRARSLRRRRVKKSRGRSRRGRSVPVYPGGTCDQEPFEEETAPTSRAPLLHRVVAHERKIADDAFANAFMSMLQRHSIGCLLAGAVTFYTFRDEPILHRCLAIALGFVMACAFERVFLNKVK